MESTDIRDFYDNALRVKATVYPILDIKSESRWIKTYYMISVHSLYGGKWILVFSPVTATVYQSLEIAKEQAQIVADNFWADVPF